MKILHVANSLAGGIGTCVMDLAVRQQNLGHDIEIWHARETPFLRSVEVGGGVPDLTIREFPVFGPVDLGYSPIMEKALTGIRGRAFSLLHYHGLWRAIARMPYLWDAYIEKPVVYSVHGALQPIALARSSWKKHIAAFAYQGNSLRRATCLHATTLTELQSIRRYGLTNPVAVIPNGVANEQFLGEGNADRFRRRVNISQDDRIILSLSRLHPSKGFPNLLHAFERVYGSMSGWILVIGGFDELNHQKELQKLVKSYNITPRVKFIGPQLGTDKHDAFSAADLFVLPTLTENFGIVIAEALASKVPVITTKGAPWEELIEYDAGWWVEPDSESLATALREATALSKDRLRTMGNNGKNLIMQKYMLDKVVDQFLRLYTWLIEGGEKPEFVVLD